MKPALERLLSGIGRRYIIVGGSVYALEVLIILVSQHLGASPVLAVTISFWTGLVVSFGTQKVFTFGDRRMHRRVLLPQVTAYGLLVLFNYGFTIFLTKLLTPSLPVVAVRTLALVITTSWNYYLYKTRVFKSDSNPVY